MTIQPWFSIYIVILYQYDKLVGCVEGTEMTQNHIGIQDRKCRTCELRFKEVEKKNRNSKNILLKIFDITTISHLAGVTVALHGIPYVREDSWHVTYPPVNYKYYSYEIFN
ncbi:hypothetical protein TNCV_4746011 [Trichonephila clavipes]|nr:hypothetical protein TNCV_4746011 [Trichonephila clavipes]